MSQLSITRISPVLTLPAQKTSPEIEGALAITLVETLHTTSLQSLLEMSKGEVVICLP